MAMIFAQKIMKKGAVSKVTRFVDPPVGGETSFILNSN
jgi:hypothetical protein